jgi:hypothetical protein
MGPRYSIDDFLALRWLLCDALKHLLSWQRERPQHHGGLGNSDFQRQDWEAGTEVPHQATFVQCGVVQEDYSDGKVNMILYKPLSIRGFSWVLNFHNV